MPSTRIAVIGGSGLEAMLKDGKAIDVDTPYGKCMSILVGQVSGTEVAFLPRHGSRHQFPPSKVNYRANLNALKQLGVERIVATNAVGAISTNMSPGDLVIPNDMIDMTKSRPVTYFESEPVVHIDVTEPYCPEIRRVLIDAGRSTGRKTWESGVMAAMEGPRYETPAEIRALRTLGCDIVGMTSSPEAFLARELEMCYATMCFASNMAAGIQSKLSHKEVLKVASKVLPDVKRALEFAVPKIKPERGCRCSTAMREGKVS